MFDSKGFTLIELLISIFIVSIIIAMSIPAYNSYVARGQIIESFSLINGLKSPTVEYYTSVGQCPNNSNGLSGMAKNTSIFGKYVESVSVYAENNSSVNLGNNTVPTRCVISAKFRTSGVSPELQGKIIYLNMGITSGAFVWGCDPSIAQGSQIIPYTSKATICLKNK